MYEKYKNSLILSKIRQVDLKKINDKNMESKSRFIFIFGLYLTFLSNCGTFNVTPTFLVYNLSCVNDKDSRFVKTCLLRRATKK